MENEVLLVYGHRLISLLLAVDLGWEWVARAFNVELFENESMMLRFSIIMEDVKTEQSEIVAEEGAETETKAETAAETAAETEVEETSVKTATNKEVDPNMSNYIRLRGLPFSAKEDDVRAFLKGLEVRSVTFTLTSMGRASGECYVELVDKIAAEEAKRFDKQEMNNRYIEGYFLLF
ncbi:unnamed protein product [Onchocerca flexuosa]|uniref:RRM domain-containing protein n=1 Tax=Onchocerca flexuosa TaxID=387005 RepID=A0A183HKD2_9BILA|nr:unnamed protein product [Onchocerca flexuosa]